ncbi:AAA-like domain protein [Rosistilla carotiformis]|uniref:AAA-like domain protein n=1 Tax=Rosistilla carotiformis TaxID=2528017 RepID=A0A518JM07_9BACT|nr:ATP-binding protein [Rosistilla carotiformis]QDV66585.1 AAA-like domain protein [Rosistilla carotiformis]
MPTSTAVDIAVDAMRRVTFDCAVRLQDVWVDNPTDVRKLHEPLRIEFANRLAEIRQNPQAGIMGWPIVGPGGAGKTHLLGDFRRSAIAADAAFVLVDMTDVRDFWETLLQGVIDSLQQDVDEGRTQQELLMRRFVKLLCPQRPVHEVLVTLTQNRPQTLKRNIDKILGYLQRYNGGRHQTNTLKHQDAIRAICCLNSEDIETQSVGYAWLQGQQLESQASQGFGFVRDVALPREIIKGIIWYMSLNGPTVVAFDQLDPIVHQVGQRQFRDVAEQEQAASDQIVQQIGAGLASMRELEWTLPIVACIESTWHILPEICLASQLDRFHEPSVLQPTSDGSIAEMIGKRLSDGYRKAGFEPPYPTWPFTSDALAQLSDNTPRHALKVCDQYRRKFLTQQAVEEVSSIEAKPNGARPDRSESSRLDDRFQELREGVDAETLLDEKAEDERLAPLYDAAMRCLMIEHQDRVPADVDVIVEREFAGGANAKPLHARVRFVFHNERGRELHFCVRGLEWKNARAFQSRLRSAMTQSGIDRDLSYRHLTIVRHKPLPGGALTQQLVDTLRKQGGQLVPLSIDQLKTLAALNTLLHEDDPDLNRWLQTRTPISAMSDLADALVPQYVFDSLSPRTPQDPEAEAFQSQFDSTTPGDVETAEEQVPVDAASASERNNLDEATPDPSPRNGSKSKASTSPEIRSDRLPLGMRVQAFGESTLVELPVPTLAKHSLVLGGAGSGKTVTVRRIVEQAALAGIPSLIVDCAQDMCTFDERRDLPSEHWGPGDAEAAAQFAQRVEQVVWTPGREDGNPLCLEPIPDFKALRSDPAELDQAVKMVEGSLREIVGATQSSQRARSKAGILSRSLSFFAAHATTCSLPAYAQMLDELPSGATVGVQNEQKLAREIADSLKVAIVQNPLLGSRGMKLDPAVLFGDERASERLRLSIISLIGLPGKSAQCDFINQLAMTLFSWIKKNPTPPGGRDLRGLVVIDEARDFVPSQGSSSCLASMRQLAAQARKYKLGIIFATQHPKDIDTKIVGNCATHFYGRANSPASLQTLTELMSGKGSQANDFPRLKTGEFYVSFPDGEFAVPAKIQLPDSLTAGRLLDEAQILEKAKASRNLVQ